MNMFDGLNDEGKARLAEAADDMPDEVVSLRATAPPADAEDATSSSDAPWAPVSLRRAREFRRRFPDANPEFIFPEIYSEDRSAVLKDVQAAEAAGHLSHRRAAEMTARELDIENFDYDSEQEQIADEQPPVTPGQGDALAAKQNAPEPGHRAELSGEKHAAWERAQARESQRREAMQRKLLREVVQEVAEVFVPKPTEREVTVIRDQHGLIERAVISDKVKGD
jgi:hypothetical protein